MMRPGESLTQCMARMKEEYERAHTIRCPYCTAVFKDEERDHSTCWGEPSHKLAWCDACDNEFVVIENVERTWETRKMGESDPGEQG